MILEAVWFKNGVEVDYVYPVIKVENADNPKLAKVYNGFGIFQSGDGIVSDDVDDFVVRVKKKDT